MASNYSESVRQASDEIKDIFCEPCVGDGKQIEAEGYCVDCSEYLCGKCYKNHGRYKAFRHHVLKDKNSMPLDVTRLDGFDVCIEKCPQHPTKVTEYFCKSCDSLGCSACITTNHRQCESVDHVPDIVKDLENNKEFVEFEKLLERKLTLIEERKDQIKSTKTDTDHMKKQPKAKLKKQRDEINKFFDKFENKMNREIGTIDKANDDTLKDAWDRCVVMEDKLKTIKTSLDTKRQNRQRCELFITMKKSIATMKDIERQFESLKEENKIQRYKLEQSPQVEEILKNTTKICIMLTAKFVLEINVKTDNDKQTPLLKGLAVVQGHLAVADSGNKSVKIIDARDGSITSETSINCDYIVSMTTVKDDQIVVLVSSSDTRPLRKLIMYRVSGSGSLNKNNCIIPKEFVYYFASIENLLYLLCSDNITVIDLKGNVQKEMKFKNSYLLSSMAINPVDETIYITNNEQNNVTCITMHGEIISNCSDDDLKKPRGIVIDNRGFVYVRTSGGKIYQLTKDCKIVQVLLENVFGEAIAYSGTDNRLYVSDDVKVKVYQLA